MNDAKKRICEQAKILFNTKGYYHVSLRDIAQAAGTTIGNLTYHFPKKQDLVLEIQKDAHNHLLHVLESRLNKSQVHDHSLAEVLETLYLTEQNETEFSYYFQNLLQLAADFPEIRTQQTYIRKIFVCYYHEAFMTLRDKGILQADVNDEGCHAAARTLVLLNTFWNQAESPTHVDELFQNHGYADTCIQLVSAMLTDKGKQQLKNLQRSEVLQR